MVWQNAENFSSRAAVICDLTSRGKTEKEKAVYTDAVLETGLAVALYNMKNDCGVILSFYDRETEQSRDLPIEHTEHLYGAARIAAVIKEYEGEPSFYRECKRHFADGTKNAAVLITPHGNNDLAKLAEELSSVTEVRVLLTGEAEEGVIKYMNTLRNVTVTEINPFDTAEGLSAAFGKPYRNY